MIPSQLKRIVRQTQAKVAGYERQNWQELQHLLAREDAFGERLARAFLMCVEGNLSAAEQQRLQAIEDLRHRLSRSTAQLEQIDYGAGSPDVTLSEQEMQQGKPTLKTVARATRSSKPRQSALLLYTLVRVFQPRSLIELGTNVGISAAYQGTALLCNGVGQLMTLEGSPAIADLARTNLEGLGLTNVAIRVGRFADTLGGVLQDMRPIDYVFIDGHHDEQATLAYFEQAYPFLTDHALLIFDDIHWSEGMKRAWAALQADTRLRLTLTVAGMGVAITGQEQILKQSYVLHLV